MPNTSEAIPKVMRMGQWHKRGVFATHRSDGLPADDPPPTLPQNCPPWEAGERTHADEWISPVLRLSPQMH